LIVLFVITLIGPPKAVMISHDNITWTTANMLENRAPINHSDRIISYLPLSHIAAQILDIHGPMYCGCQVFFARADALKGSLSTTLKFVRPTVFFGVPRVWEKFYEKMMEVARTTTGLKKDIGAWAKGLGTQKTQMNQFGGGGGAPCGFGCANWLVFSAIKGKLGLDQCRLAFTGAAPISIDILNYFASLDIPIYEVFGQSECTGPHTVNVTGEWKIGTCGRPLIATESRVDDSTKELCYRGRHIFMGYMFNPEKTAETIDDDGWLHSGDIGEFDDDKLASNAGESGFMRITGRIKELIITAGGENIPPVLIEHEFLSQMPCLSNCIVIGDRRKFLSILLCLKTEVDEDGIPTNVLTGDSLVIKEQLGSGATTVEGVMEDEKWTKYFDDGMARANKNATSKAQKVQKWALLASDFSERGGELTPTLKLKRSVVHEKYEEIIEAFYN